VRLQRLRDPRCKFGAGDGPEGGGSQLRPGGSIRITLGTKGDTIATLTYNTGGGLTVVGTNPVTALGQLLPNAQHRAEKLLAKSVERWHTEVYPQMSAIDPDGKCNWPDLAWGFLLGAGVPNRLINLELCQKLVAGL
jgi:hypothetical protein